MQTARPPRRLSFQRCLRDVAVSMRIVYVGVKATGEGAIAVAAGNGVDVFARQLPRHPLREDTAFAGLSILHMRLLSIDC